MNPFLIDVPVRINIWIRPDCQKRQWEVIRKVKPSILFLQSDGGRNETEWESIRQNRKMIDESIDWDCQVYRFYEDHNNGMYAMSKKVIQFIWAMVDRAIFLEDDQIPSISFFRYCFDLLERYKDDERIECICGFNHFGTWKCNSDYFFSRQGSIWGTATWRRVFETRNIGFSYAKDEYVMSLLKQRTRHNKIAWERLNAYSQNLYFEGHVAGGEFWKEFNMYSQNMLQIIPRKNMIKNIGFDNSSTHIKDFSGLPKTIKRLFNSETYELEFPLNYAAYVIPDIEYERKRNNVMHYNENCIKKFFRGILFYIICFFRSPRHFFEMVLLKFRKKTVKKQNEE